MNETYTALIADVVQSRKLGDDARRELQKQLRAFLGQWNRTHKKLITARFVITIGDEFQGLLRAAYVIPDLLWELEREFADVTFRVGFGYGPLATPIERDAIGMDGPAFHHARAAITSAKATGRLGGVFDGFGPRKDDVLNGFARALWLQRSRWSTEQSEAVHLARTGMKQEQIGESLGISQQAVSSRIRSAGWDAYHEAEQGWRAALAAADHPEETENSF